MAKRQSTNNGKFVFNGFHNLEFSPAEKAALQTQINDRDWDLEDNIIVIVEQNYKVGVSWDENHDVYHISATCKNTESKYAGICFTLRHINLDRGMRVLRHVFDTLIIPELYSLGDNENRFDY